MICSKRCPKQEPECYHCGDCPGLCTLTAGHGLHCKHSCNCGIEWPSGVTYVSAVYVPKGPNRYILTVSDDAGLFLYAWQGRNWKETIELYSGRAV